MTKFLAILGAIAATVVAIYAVKTYERITLERHIISNLSNKKGILESQIEKLKGEKQHIEFEIKKRSGDLYGLLEYIEKQRSVINILQLEKKKSEKGIYKINEKKKSLDDKNTVLSESNTKLENFSKELIFNAFIGDISTRLIALKNYPSIPIFSKGDNEYSFDAGYKINELFTKGSWNLTLRIIKEASEQYTHGKKIEVRGGSPITLEGIVESTLNMIVKSSPLERYFTQELLTKVNDYKQAHQEDFKTPLSFRFTGLDMKVKEANAERERLLSIFNTEEQIGELTFDSMPSAAAYRLFQHLHHKP